MSSLQRLSWPVLPPIYQICRTLCVEAHLFAFKRFLYLKNLCTMLSLNLVKFYSIGKSLTVVVAVRRDDTCVLNFRFFQTLFT